VIVVVKEIICAIIDREFVTNDPHTINRALLAECVVEYLSRSQVQRLAGETHRPAWYALANTACRVVLVDGVCYGREINEPPIEFAISESYLGSGQ
jgi:hypothetical protein